MKRIEVLLIISILCCSIVGCNRISNRGGNSVISVADGEIIESKKVYGSDNLKAIKEILSSYDKKADLEELNAIENNFIVIKDREIVGNEDLWNTFYENTINNRDDSIIIVKYTEQNDPILTYLSYLDDEYFMVEDNTRDRYDEEIEDYYEYKFKYLKIFEDDKYKYAYLLDDKDITLDELNYSLKSKDSDKWISYGFIFYTNK